MKKQQRRTKKYCSVKYEPGIFLGVLAAARVVALGLVLVAVRAICGVGGIVVDTGPVHAEANLAGRPRVAGSRMF